MRDRTKGSDAEGDIDTYTVRVGHPTHGSGRDKLCSAGISEVTSKLIGMNTT